MRFFRARVAQARWCYHRLCGHGAIRARGDRCGLGGAMVTYFGVRVACWKDFAWVPTGDRKDLRDAISWSIEEVRVSEGATTEAMLGKEITTWLEGGLMATFKVLRTWHKKHSIGYGWLVHLMDISASNPVITRE